MALKHALSALAICLCVAASQVAAAVLFNVHASHRTATASQWFCDKISRNVTRAKQEMFAPYATGEFHEKNLGEVLAPRHISPAHLTRQPHQARLAATPANRKRRTIPKRRLYLNADTRQAVLTEGRHANCQPWHVGHGFPATVPEMPAIQIVPSVTYDLTKREYAATSLFNEGKRRVQVKPRHLETDFSSSAPAGEGMG